MEPRILFSADSPFAVLDVTPLIQSEVSVIDVAANESSLENDISDVAPKEIIVLDSALPQIDLLIKEFESQNSENSEILLLEKGDAINQISQFLSERSNITAMHVFSHGANGELQFGDQILDAVGLLERASDIAAWRGAFSSNADLLLYGCEVAEDGEGRQFVDSLARLTGTDVSASSNMTGAASRGGDWELEYRKGSIETDFDATQILSAKYDATLAIYTVSNLADAGTGSLREAITLAVAGDTIEFGVAGTISLTTALPDITASIVIDGTSAPGYANSPIVYIDGDATTGLDASGLVLASGSDNSTVKALGIINFDQSGISIEDSVNHIVQSNYIGTDGVNAAGNINNGIQITNSSGNTIGGVRESGEGNLISGNGVGVSLSGASSSGNFVFGNRIGVNETGDGVIGNTVTGILVSNGAHSNEIGASRQNGHGNVISGNEKGIVISDAGSDNNQIWGNRIGVSFDLTLILGNTGDGIQLLNGAQNNVIGGTEAGEGNTITGNNKGVLISGAGTSGNVLKWNWIGLSADGTAAFGNTSYGVEISDGASANSIGTTHLNVIAGNSVGIKISGVGTENNIITNNLIGTDNLGTAALPNALSGIEITDGASSNQIGGSALSQLGNVVSGNGTGILISGAGTSNNLVNGNRIGVDAGFLTGLGNSGAGIRIEAGSNGNIIGGGSFGEGNFIGDNTNGIVITGQNTVGNSVIGNHIGSGWFGTGAIGNSSHGILVNDGASSNNIGAEGGRNYIVHNQIGVELSGANTTQNTVASNTIGILRDESASGGNTLVGVKISGGANNNTIGGQQAGMGSHNMVSGNGIGIELSGADTDFNTVTGNLIGLSNNGNGSWPNTVAGIKLHDGASNNNIGGTTYEYRNIVSGNAMGIQVSGPDTSGNLFEWNYVGTNWNGMSAVGNTTFGYLFEAGTNNNQVGVIGVNIISGNSIGLSISGADTTNNTISRSFIGLGVATDTIIPNTNEGVLIDQGANDNTLIGLNVSGNGSGITITGQGTNQNIVRDSGIGLTGDRQTAAGNTTFGILLDDGAQNNTIGGNSWASGGNTITSNETGVLITGAGTKFNDVIANYIGTTELSETGFGNLGDGVRIESGASENSIGGSLSGQGNIIANNNNGVVITDSSYNELFGNHIGINDQGTLVLANTESGVFIENLSYNNIIGGPNEGHRNLISGNGWGVRISGAGANINDVVNNYIGTDISGTLGAGNSNAGVLIEAGATANTIGGDSRLNLGNLISDNQVGVSIQGANTLANTVQGNYIGTTADGNSALGNSLDGLQIGTSSQFNQVGGNSALGLGNLISGNLRYGIYLDDAGSIGNTIQGNRIGTNVTVTSAIANDSSGIYISNSANVTIGGTAAAVGNVISGNGEHGISLFGTYAINIQGNNIGTTGNGVTPLGNAKSGIHLGAGVSDTVIGGPSFSVAGNLVSGNGEHGITIDGQNQTDLTTRNFVYGNYIGTDISGSVAVGNVGHGVLVTGGADQTRIGFDGDSGTGNLISGHTQGSGIFITGNTTSDTQVKGNTIGTDVAGNSQLGNKTGIQIDESIRSIIGSLTASQTNLISGNVEDGIVIMGATSSGVSVLGNRIGTNAQGTAANGNGRHGIFLDGSSGAIIGAANSPNVISGNAIDGIHFSNSNNNTVTANVIGLDSSEQNIVPNGSDGIHLANASNYNLIGGLDEASGNLIVGNQGAGVAVIDTTSSENTIVLNRIYGNTGEAIDIGPSGINTNDPGDVDSGANELLNSPSLSSAFTDGSDSVSVTIDIDSMANTQFRVDVYGTDDVELNISGHSKYYIGTELVTTLADGSLSTQVQFSASSPIGDALTATATRVDNDGSLLSTSEFSAPVLAAETNVAPVIASLGGQATATVQLVENESTVTTIEANDANDEPLSFSIEGGDDAQLFSIGSDSGELSLLSPVDFESPVDANSDNTYEVLIQASDEQGAVDTQLVFVSIQNANDNPEGEQRIIVSVNENQLMAGSAQVSDPDGDTLSYSIASGADGNLFSIDASTGDLSFLGVPNFEAPIDRNADNTYEVKVGASDAQGGFYEQIVEVAVGNVNDAPVGDSLVSVSTNENQNYATTVQIQDEDSSALRFSIIGGEDAAHFSINASSGVLSFLSTPSYANANDSDGNNQYEVLVRAVDNENAEVQQRLLITVNNVNEAPIVGQNQSITVLENQSQVGTVQATDPDGDNVSYSIIDGQDSNKFQIDQQSGAIEFTLPPDYENATDADTNNVYKVAVLVSDVSGNSSEQKLTVTVEDINEAGVFTTNGFDINELQSQVGSVEIIDPEGDDIEYVIVGGEDAHLFSLNSESAELSFIAPPDFENPTDAQANNTYRLVISGRDSGGNSVTGDILVTVRDGNDAPLAVTDSLSATENVVLEIHTLSSILANDSDPENGALSLVGFSEPENGTLLQASEGVLNYTPNENFVGQDSFEYEIEDNAGNRAGGLVQIDVSAVVAPVVSSASPIHIETKTPSSGGSTPSSSSGSNLISTTSLPTTTTLITGTGLDSSTSMSTSSEFTAQPSVAVTSNLGSEDKRQPGEVIPGVVTVTETLEESEDTTTDSQNSSTDDGEEDAESSKEETDAGKVANGNGSGLTDQSMFGDDLIANGQHRAALQGGGGSGQSGSSSGLTGAGNSQSGVTLELTTESTSRASQAGMIQNLFNLAVAPSYQSAELSLTMDAIRRQAEEKEEEEFTAADQAVALAPRVLAPSITVGVVTWMLRSGVLVAATISATPVLRQLDLIPVLAEAEDETDDEDDQLVRDIDKIKTDSDRTKGNGESHE